MRMQFYDDQEADKMVEAEMLAGMAFNNANLGYVHAMGSPTRWSIRCSTRCLLCIAADHG